MLVAVKQVIPENEVSLFGGALYFKAKHLPAVYIVLTSLIALPFHVAAKVIPFVVFGAYGGWMYLRFFNEDGGDGSEEFRFASFFPEPLQPVAENVAQRTSKFTKLGSSIRGEGGTLYTNNSTNAEGTAMLGLSPAPGDADAARRRERGVKALEQRLGSMKKVATGGGGKGGGSSSQVNEEKRADDVETAVQEEKEEKKGEVK